MLSMEIIFKGCPFVISLILGKYSSITSTEAAFIFQKKSNIYFEISDTTKTYTFYTDQDEIL